MTPSQQKYYYYYYYYYNDTDSNVPSLSPLTSNSPTPEQAPKHKMDFTLTYGCKDYLLSPPLTNVHSNDLSFTFVIEAAPSFGNIDNIAKVIIENSSPSTLICKNPEKPMSSGQKGIFLLHFPPIDPLIKVADCTPALSASHSCLILKGRLVVASNQPISIKDKNAIYANVEDTVDHLSGFNTLKGEIFSSQFLGPAFQREQNYSGDHVVVIITILFFIPIIDSLSFS